MEKVRFMPVEGTRWTAYRRLRTVLDEDRTKLYLQDTPSAMAYRDPSRLAMLARNLRRARMGWPGYGLTDEQTGKAPERASCRPLTRYERIRGRLHRLKWRMLDWWEERRGTGWRP